MGKRSVPEGVFVAGTGTGVGKTVVSILLIAYLRSKGLKVAPFKPSETGCAPAPIDSLALLAAAGGDYRVEEVCPYPFALPAAPQAAASAAGAKIKFQVISRSYASLKKKADFVVVEGAGALATPYASGLTGIEIAGKLGIPVIVVSSQLLGTIGQTISCVRALKYAKVRCLGVILSKTEPLPTGPHEETNAQLLSEHLGAGPPLLGQIPFLSIPGGSIDKLAPPLVTEWATGKLNEFSRCVGAALDAALGL